MMHQILYKSVYKAGTLIFVISFAPLCFLIFYFICVSILHAFIPKPWIVLDNVTVLFVGIACLCPVLPVLKCRAATAKLFYGFQT